MLASFKRKLILFFCGSFLFSSLLAQELQVGDQIPDVVFNDIWNWNSSSLRLNEFKGKLIVLDFWGVFCVPCLEGFAKIDSLQKKLQDHVQFIAVNKGFGVDSTQSFFKYHPKVHRPSIPFITNDTLLHRYFPHQGNPYYVILDKSGKVLIKADYFEFAEKTFEELLKGNTDWVVPEYDRVEVNTLFDSRWDGMVDFASYIVRAPLESGLNIESGSLHGKNLIESGSIEQLYRFAFENLYDKKLELHRPGRVQLLVRDKDRFTKPNGINGFARFAWMRENYYRYVLRVPDNYAKNLYQLMLEDLQRYFNVEGKIVTQSVDHLVLINSGNAKKLLRTKGSDPKFTFLGNSLRMRDNGPIREIRNLPYARLSSVIKSRVENIFGLPFADETDITGNIDFAMKGADLDNLTLEKLKENLERYGLRLMNKKLPVRVLVLKEKY
ncbi:DUF3738 domain-containing protein [Olivibacter sp. SA151]|uniref:redoxin family protein n=1 Tax=Olivibacter jilunii TaxID=985016 RepID=UPI003F13EBD7